MFSTIWSPGKPDRHWRIYLTGGCLLAATCIGSWLMLTMNRNPMIISGKVLNTQNKPVAEARIYFTDGPAPLPEIAALSNIQGEFSVSVSKAGTYQIGCTADGFNPANVSVAIKDGQNASVIIVVKK